jgi:hypothetical protein
VAISGPPTTGVSGPWLGIGDGGGTGPTGCTCTIGHGTGSTARATVAKGEPARARLNTAEATGDVTSAG